MKRDMQKLPQARQDDLFVEVLGEDLFVYDARRHCVHRLNRVAAVVWRHCDGQRTIEDATSLLSREVQQPLDDEVVRVALDTLAKAHLLEGSAPRPEPTAGGSDLSRRRLMQAGTAGLLLLPAVTLLSEPARAAGLSGQSTDDAPGVKGESGKGDGVVGEGQGVGVKGVGKTWHGVAGLSESTTGGSGVYGKNTAGGTGVVGESDTWMGVYGKSISTKGGAGVMGEAIGPGVIGQSKTWYGVFGETESTTGGAGVGGSHKGSGAGVEGKSVAGVGVSAFSEKHEAIHAETKSPTTAAIAGFSSADGTGAAIYGESRGRGAAGFFKGDVLVTGDIRLINADCAEDFDIAGAQSVEPGTVMVLGQEGSLEPSQVAYDKRVAGVISGAGDYKPGIVLDKQDVEGPQAGNRQPVALMGKVFCKVDARFEAIEVGDLITTSATPGHAMKASDPARAFGAVIGKALRPLDEGQGLIPILISLQ